LRPLNGILPLGAWKCVAAVAVLHKGPSSCFQRLETRCGVMRLRGRDVCWYWPRQRCTGCRDGGRQHAKGQEQSSGFVHQVGGAAA
jgi:hypothetical protein